jgi:hypothetical protein
MDGQRFDSLARTLASGSSRRTLLRGMVGGALAAVGLRAGGTAAQANKVDVCHYDADTDTYEHINVSANALPAHVAHGDRVASDCTGNFELDFESCECECTLDASACTGNFELDTGSCACVCGITSCPTGYTLNSTTCACDLCTTCTGPTGQAGICGLDPAGNFACVTTRFGHDTGTDRDDCRNTCSSNAACGAGWACVSDSGCGGVRHCHQLAT